MEASPSPKYDTPAVSDDDDDRADPDAVLLLAEVDRLMRANSDPPSQPYRSKYEARRRLLDASSSSSSSSSSLLDAARAFRLGKIAVDTEEPHAEAEQHLRKACEVFFPGLHAAAVGGSNAAAADPGGKGGSSPGDEPPPPEVELGEALVAVRRGPGGLRGCVKKKEGICKIDDVSYLIKRTNCVVTDFDRCLCFPIHRTHGRR